MRKTNLAINNNPNSSLNIRTLIQKDRTKPIRMPHHRNPRHPLNTRYQRIASAGNDEVDVFVEVEESCYVGAGLDCLDVGGGEGGQEEEERARVMEWERASVVCRDSLPPFRIAALPVIINQVKTIVIK